MTQLSAPMKAAWEWLSFDNSWRPSPFYAATMNALVRRGYVRKRIGYGHVVEYQATREGRSALSVNDGKTTEKEA